MWSLLWTLWEACCPRALGVILVVCAVVIEIFWGVFLGGVACVRALLLGHLVYLWVL